jgi:hypothetical protein
MDATVNKYQYHRDGTLPRNGEIFVFGSNFPRGIHGAGAAKAALQFGAKHGQGRGPVGNTYAIPTKDGDIQTMEIDTIALYINQFMQYAINNPDKMFFVTRIGCGLANFADRDIAPLFAGSPINCNFAEQWQPYLN